MVLSERGESQNPTGSSQQLAGWDGSAQRAHAGRRRLSDAASPSPELPPTHEATSNLAARGQNRRSVRPRAAAGRRSRAGQSVRPARTPRAGTKQQRA